MNQIKHPSLQNFQTSKITLNNRTVVAPLSRVSTRGNGVPTSQMVQYYGEYARGGFGMIITEGTYTDRNFSQGYKNQPGIVTDKQVNGWREVVKAVHSSGSKIILQLMHAGALSQHLTATVGPSAIKPLRHMMPAYGGSGDFLIPKAMAYQDIDTAITGFVRSALNAIQAGFDGVEIHGANGYLLDQFLTAYTNTRQDEFGGSVRNRVRLLSSVIAAVRSAIGDKPLISARVSQGKVNDFDYLWPGGIDDAKIIFTELKKAGADLIHFASEGKGFEHGCMTPDGVSLPKYAREVTGLPVIANGGMHDITTSAWAVNEGHGDLVSLGTGAISCPHWPNSLANGDIIPPVATDLFSKGVTLSAVDEVLRPKSQGAVA